MAILKYVIVYTHMYMYIVYVNTNFFSHHFACKQEILDADDKPLKNHSGQTMARDIVQFVPFRDLMRKAGPNGCVVCLNLQCIGNMCMYM